MAVDIEHHPHFIVYGPSGSGLSTAQQIFREFGFLTFSGVQVSSIHRFLSAADAEKNPGSIAPELNPFEVDAQEVFDHLQSLKAHQPFLKLLYLSTPDEVLIQRYAKADKPHPYEQQGLRETIELEQKLFKTLKPLSDYHIDTSTTTPTELRLKIGKVLGIPVQNDTMTIYLKSFGFKNGVPTDAELVFDMRFLPNPFYDEALRPMTGLDESVKNYVFGFPEAQQFMHYWQELLTHTLPLYQRHGKTRVTVGIGCTGGQHRSVAMTMEIAKHLKQTFPAYDIRIVHREQSHWPQQQPATLASS